MMIIIAHRGQWFSQTEKNTMLAFDRALNNGYGLETDVRDTNGKLVVSHDIPHSDALLVSDFFKLYKSKNRNSMLAINIKADGLKSKLIDLLREYSIENYFVFDMSIPETVLYARDKVSFFTRQSEYESEPAFYKETQGIWLDAFNEEWYNSEIILRHLENGKMVCIVSPEVHKRDHLSVWQILKEINSQYLNGLMLCTDKPTEAKRFFNEQN